MKHTVVGLALVALFAGACRSTPSPDEVAGRLVPIDGRVELFRDGTWEPVSEASDVAIGERVRTGDDGWALLKLFRGGTLEIAPGGSVMLSRIPDVEKGHVLAEGVLSLGLDGDELEVGGEDAVIRVDKTTGVRLAVYRGEATLPLSVSEAPVHSLEQAYFSAGRLTRAPVPIALRTNDRWDVRFLGEFIDLGASLQQLQQGLDPQLEGKRATRAVVQVLSGRMSPVLLSTLLASELSHAEVVLVAVLASAGGVAVEPVLREIIDLRDAGASWEVIAGWLGVGRTVLVVLRDIFARILSAATPPGPVVSGGGPGAGSSGGPGGGEGPAPGGDGPIKPTPGDGPRIPDPPDPPPPCADVSCAVQEIADDIDLPVGV